MKTMKLSNGKSVDAANKTAVKLPKSADYWHHKYTLMRRRWRKVYKQLRKVEKKATTRRNAG